MSSDIIAGMVTYRCGERLGSISSNELTNWSIICFLLEGTGIYLILNGTINLVIAASKAAITNGSR